MPQHELTDMLSVRMRNAIERAQATVAEADLLTALSRLIRDPTSMAKRCAWCARLALGRRWTPADKIPLMIHAQLEDRMTHGICGDCMRRFQREGKDRAYRSASRSAAGVSGRRRIVDDP